MIFQRGAKECYDGWASLGNEGWGWDDVLPLFKRAQNQERGSSDAHGVGGPMNVSDLRDPNVLSECFVNACKDSGLPMCNDFNTGDHTGFGMY